MAADSMETRPTRIRYLVLALTTMVAVLLYVDRICLGYAKLYVSEDIGITEMEMSFVLSSFFWGYALAQVPAGLLSDRYGARLILALYLALWSLTTGLLGWVHGLTSLLLLRLCCGLFE